MPGGQAESSAIPIGAAGPASGWDPTQTLDDSGGGSVTKRFASAALQSGGSSAARAQPRSRRVSTAAERGRPRVKANSGFDNAELVELVDKEYGLRIEEADIREVAARSVGLALA